MRGSEQIWNTIPAIQLFGAEDVDDEPVVSQEDTNDDEPVENDEKFSAEYVSKLRKEAADRRVATKDANEKADALQAELDALKKAEMSDIDKMRTDLETAQSALDAATEASTTTAANLKSERIHNAVTLAAIEQGFVDPTDALSMVSQDDLVTDEGEIDVKAVEKNLKALAKKKPHLLKSNKPGSYDGGGSGKPKTPGTHDERVAAYVKDMTTSGGRVLRQ